MAQSDALLVLGLLSAPGHAQSSLLLAALFHVVAPLQSAASVWSRLFYFDFKRLEAWGSPLLLRRFEEFLSLASWWVPLPIGLVTLTLMSMLWRGPYWVLAIELAGLAVVRSRLALVHIRAYSLADHGFMLKLFVGIIGIAAVTPFLTRLPPEGALGVVVGLMATGLLVLGRSQRPLALRAPHGLVEPSIWLSHLLRANEPVQLGLARVDRRLSTVGRLARALRDPIGDGVQARLSNDTLVWFSRQRLSVREIVERGAGTLRELELGQLAVTGRNALDVGLESTTWKRRLGNMLAAERDGILDLGALQARLSCAHPDARIIELTSRRAFVELGATNVRELRRLLLDATHGMSRFRALGENEVAVVAPAGEPLALIVVPKRTRPAQEWKRSVAALVEWANIAWTLHHTR